MKLEKQLRPESVELLASVYTIMAQISKACIYVQIYSTALSLCSIVVIDICDATDTIMLLACYSNTETFPRKPQMLENSATRYSYS